MTAALDLALIINTYNQPEYLTRVLKSLSQQRSLPDEVLVADDGSSEDTRRVFAQWASVGLIRAEHVWQPHDGFRRARVLNEAIFRARSRYLVFLDGDSVPHPEFIADHRRLARPQTFIQGHRALTDQRGAAFFGASGFQQDRRRAIWRGQVQGWRHLFRWPRPLLRVRSDLRGIRGCNLGIWRDHLIKANGYNEAFIGWGREDSELAVRLMNAGVQRLDVRGWALCVHLWHPPAERSNLKMNDELLAKAQQSKATRCEVGFDAHLPRSAA
jgi:glycosyltransferase involved in cell wall biosynthesis